MQKWCSHKSCQDLTKLKGREHNPRPEAAVSNLEIELRD